MISYKNNITLEGYYKIININSNYDCYDIQYKLKININDVIRIRMQYSSDNYHKFILYITNESNKITYVTSIEDIKVLDCNYQLEKISYYD